MKQIITIICLLLSVTSNAQKKESNLMDLLQHADSVELLSHQDLVLRATIEEMKQGMGTTDRSIATPSGGVNDCIVTQRKRINQNSLDELIYILGKQYDSDIAAERASCFVPHQSIVMYHDGKCAIADICFDCRQTYAHGGLVLPDDFLSTDEQWEDLKQFFIRNGISRKIQRH
ncbi:MAG: hypothetical protein EOP49_20015 [Sphingobacteriales bacterium]|nr:MAG: hypothetical protein EOP49_20015 [Sphingobacteriales bacterium]